MEVCVSTLAVEWIEIDIHDMTMDQFRSPPSRWSGLKSLSHFDTVSPPLSPPSRWSGLKFRNPLRLRYVPHVSTLAVEWIEITPA